MRLDSGDLGAHAKAVRALLDRAGWRDVSIFASGNLDEHRIAALIADGAPIDGYGVGTALDTSADAPALDLVYKLHSYAGVPRRKRSEGKATWPGAKQVCRRLGPDGLLAGDTVQRDGEPCSGEPLLQPVIRGGRRLGAPPALDALREACAAQLRRLPPALRSLEPAPPYPVAISPALVALAQWVDARAH